MKITFDNATLELTATGKAYRAVIGDESFEVEVLRVENGVLELRIDGKRVTAQVSADGAKRWVTVNGQTIMLTKQAGAGRKSAGHEHASGLAAPMPGVVRSVNVAEGEIVNKGQTLLVLEAMKMEIRIQARQAGTVVRLLVNQGQTVEREQVLIEIE